MCLQCHHEAAMLGGPHGCLGKHKDSLGFCPTHMRDALQPIAASENRVDGHLQHTGASVDSNRSAVAQVVALVARSDPQLDAAAIQRWSADEMAPYQVDTQCAGPWQTRFVCPTAVTTWSRQDNTASQDS